ncbi:glutamyl-tRNA(Gln) amidotransferase, subunit A [Aspergillus stella-maris]|uniref:glutamyl-tRNA(Gln) amidotransferase, subunit A n=1 Tax=Aspergillus stella-maris TaxID=1810926 RepID=UPI003CCCD96F
MLFNNPIHQPLTPCAFLLLIFATNSLARITQNGRLAVVDGINYYVGEVPVSTLSPIPALMSSSETDSESPDIIPITVVQSKAQLFRSENLEKAISNFTRDDDVFQKGFLQAKSYHDSFLIVSPTYHSQEGILTANLTEQIPQGPYFMSTATGSLYQAFRLYADHQLAFTQPALSDREGGFMPLPAVTEGAMTQSVAVPSRLYYTPTPAKPLAGLRLGIKDIFHLRGLRTSGGNRAYHDFYAPQNKTGSAVQRLIDAGAVIVGKMGTVQFANGDNPTADWVDFHCPFNPRGDGYQSPGGSPSGPAAGIASYDWLDIAVGSDTGGSMRDPASKNGVFGNRPSWGAVGTDGVLPLCDALDSVGVFARDARVWRDVLRAWYNLSSNPLFGLYPKRLYYSSDSFPDESTEAGKILEDVVQKIEDFLGVKREVVSTFSRWEESHPPGAPSYTNILSQTYAVLTSVYQYKHLAVPFMNAYSSSHSGRNPFINPGPLVRWEWGQTQLSKNSNVYTEALTNKTTFQNWWNFASPSSGGYGTPHNTTCSEGIYIYPYSTGKTAYRNTYPNAPTTPPMGFKDGRIATLAGTPDFVVPVGEVSYLSAVTGEQEYMPVTLSFGAAVGCDHMLADLVRAVRTGSRLYG